MALHSFEELLNKYIAGIISEDEMKQLRDLLNDPANAEKLTSIVDTELQQNHFQIPENEMVFSKIRQNIARKIAKKETAGRVFSMRRFAVAAAFILLAGIGIYWLLQASQKGVSVPVSDTAAQHDLLPGGNKAILKLADGTEIILDTVGQGTLAHEGKVQIIQLNDGRLSYSLEGQVSEMLYNTISTPVGGQYQLVLSDGTKVWLNSSSSLRFPAAFAGGERIVELTGEGYFEVAANAVMPFHVKVNALDIQVLGTHFNVNSYDDELFVRTTLLEGKVNVRQGAQAAVLSPGQQAAVDKAGTFNTLNAVNVEEVIAWKNGLFHFESADLSSILRQASRWYNVAFVYEDEIEGRFSGQISRNVNLSQLLKILELTGKVRFSITNNKVTVRK